MLPDKATLSLMGIEDGDYKVCSLAFQPVRLGLCF
jgi:hypothetical protein